MMLTATDIEIVPFKAEHYKAMDLWPDDDLMRVLPTFEQGLKDAEIPGQSFTAIEGGTILGVGGIKTLWPGVGEAWAVYPRDVATYGRQIYRVSRAALEHIESAHGYWRVQATARCDWYAAVRFLQALRFTIEGKMEKYGIDGSDHYLMARTS
jgi:hypothetical protein